MIETTDTTVVGATAERQGTAGMGRAHDGTAPDAPPPVTTEQAAQKTDEVPLAPEGSPGEKPEKLTLQELLDAGVIHPLARQALDEERGKARQAEERMLRVLAETDNQRKRMQREQDERIRHANESLLLEMLPVLDNLERSLAHSSDGANIAGLRKGVELTLSQFRHVIEHVGVQGIAVAAGDRFDPRLQEAVFRDDGADLPEQTVVSVVQAGFKYRDRVLRPARVVVSSGKGHCPAEQSVAPPPTSTEPREPLPAPPLDEAATTARPDPDVAKEGR